MSKLQICVEKLTSPKICGKTHKSENLWNNSQVRKSRKKKKRCYRLVAARPELRDAGAGRPGGRAPPYQHGTVHCKRVGWRVGPIAREHSAYTNEQ